MQDSEVIERTPIEIALEVDKDGFITAKKFYKWFELDESNYSCWVKINILENPFAEKGVDYKVIKNKYQRNYKISASFAKKLATMFRTGKGERARIYFDRVNNMLIKLSKERMKLYIGKVRSEAVQEALTDVLVRLLN